jgi:hypothetical protein
MRVRVSADVSIEAAQAVTYEVDEEMAAELEAVLVAGIDITLDLGASFSARRLVNVNQNDTVAPVGNPVAVRATFSNLQRERVGRPYDSPPGNHV